MISKIIFKIKILRKIFKLGYMNLKMVEKGWR